MTAIIGAPAPAFDAEAYVRGAGEPCQVSLAGQAGSWVVLFFYPRDFTFVCPTELHAFAQLAPEFAAEEAVVIGASTDSYWSHQAWLQTHPLLAGVDFPVLADTTQRIAADYGGAHRRRLGAARNVRDRSRRDRAPREHQRPERRPLGRRDAAGAAGAAHGRALPGGLAARPADPGGRVTAMDDIRDVIIVGGACAGYTAAVYAARGQPAPARDRGLRRRRPAHDHLRRRELPGLPGRHPRPRADGALPRPGRALRRRVRHGRRHARRRLGTAVSRVRR